MFYQSMGKIQFVFNLPLLSPASDSRTVDCGVNVLTKINIYNDKGPRFLEFHESNNNEVEKVFGK